MISAFGLCLNLFPLDIGSIHTSSSDDALIFLVHFVLVESASGDMLGVARHSSAFLGVFDARILVEAHATVIVGHSNDRSVLVAVNRVDIGSVGAQREHSHHIPPELASGSLPESWMREDFSSILLQLFVRDVIELFAVSLINCPQVLRVLGPVHSSDSR